MLANNMGFFRVYATTFANKTSLRGFGKAKNSPYLCLRIMWMAFVVVMIAVLIAAVIHLVIEYLKYPLVVHVVYTDGAMDAFPAVTICNVASFSKHASVVWQSGNFLPPSEFAELYGQNILRLLGDKRYIEARTLYESDIASTYYQYVGNKHWLTLAPNISETIQLCVMEIEEYSKTVDVPCTFQTKQLWFNQHQICHTLQLSSKRSGRCKAVQIVLTDAGHEYFPLNISRFQQSGVRNERGFIVAIHEPDTFPNFAKTNIYLEPNFNYDIQFETVMFSRVNTPNSLCQDRGQSYTDMGIAYKYSQIACVRKELFDFILDNCGCLHSLANQVEPAQDKSTYCDSIDFRNLTSFLRRAMCVRMLSIPTHTTSLQTHTCGIACTTFDYSLSRSQKSWDIVIDRTIASISRELDWGALLNDSFPSIMKPAVAVSLTEAMEDGAAKVTAPFEPKDSVYLKLWRRNFRRLTQSEDMKYTLAGMFASLGGMGSLTIGLSTAFFVELIEALVYALKRHSVEECPTEHNNHQTVRATKVSKI